MTIDERLDQLTERHEALAQTVEFLTRNLESARGYSRDLAEGTARLLHIAQVQKQRLEGQKE